MKSYKQLYRKLPADLIDQLSNFYSPPDLDKIFAGFMSDRPLTLRVNRLKTDIRQVMERFRQDNIKFERVLWYEDALIIRNIREKEMESHPLFQNGHIYLQSLSSMVPPLVLKPKPGSKVLDLAAAPGSKTTQLAAIMENKGFILANELNQIRMERLKFNIERQGAAMVEIRHGDGKRLEPKWESYFDNVLLDAPCSGVGLFDLENSQTYRGWSLRFMNQLVKEQRKLMETAVRALKPGGTMVYSTCTLMQQENAENVNWLLNKYDKIIRLQTLDFTLTGAEQVQRITSLGQGNMLTIIPSSLYEGFFVTRFKKIEK